MEKDYWDLYRNYLKLAGNIEDLQVVAIAVLKCMHKEEPNREIIQICGPISTGGLGNEKANIIRFRHAIEFAERKGLFVFNQFNMHEAMNRLVKNGKVRKDKKGYPIGLIDDLYVPVFCTRLIRKGLFLPGWEKSVGAYWENNTFKNLRIPVEDYPVEWLDLL